MKTYPERFVLGIVKFFGTPLCVAALLAAMVAVTVVASLLAAIRPANQASKIPPAVALRTTE